MVQSEKEKADLCPHLFKHQGGCVNYEHCDLHHVPGVIANHEGLLIVVRHIDMLVSAHIIKT